MHEDGISVLELNSVVRVISLFLLYMFRHEFLLFGFPGYVTDSIDVVIVEILKEFVDVCSFQNTFDFAVQKLLVTHPYKNLMTFGGCKQDFMLVVGQSISSNTSKDKPTEKHLFAMDVSKVNNSSDINIGV